MEVSLDDKKILLEKCSKLLEKGKEIFQDQQM